MYYTLTPEGDSSETLKSVAASCPEQFLAVACMFKAAAEMAHCADRFDNEGTALGNDLATTSLRLRGVARALLSALCPGDNTYAELVVELARATAA